MYGEQTYHGDYIVKYINDESLCCTPGTNTMWYANNTLIRKILKTESIHLSNE